MKEKTLNKIASAIISGLVVILILACGLWYKDMVETPAVAILGDLIDDDLEWDKQLVLYYTAQDGQDYRMLCRDVFVSAPFTVNDQIALRIDDVDYSASYKEVGDKLIFSEWRGPNDLYPVVHAAQLKKVNGSVILVSKTYITFQECGLTTGDEADITAYLEEHPLNCQIYLASGQRHFGVMKYDASLPES